MLGLKEKAKYAGCAVAGALGLRSVPPYSPTFHGAVSHFALHAGGCFRKQLEQGHQTMWLLLCASKFRVRVLRFDHFPWTQQKMSGSWLMRRTKLFGHKLQQIVL